MAGIFTSLIFEKRNQIKNERIQAQLNKALGTPAVPGVEVPGPVQPGQPPLTAGGSPGTGVLGVPLDQRQEALAVAAMGIPGIPLTDSLPLYERAIKNRQDQVVRQMEFTSTMFQDQQQFNQKEGQDLIEWQRKQALLDAQHVMNFEKTMLDMALASRSADLADTREARAKKLDALSTEQKQLTIKQATIDIELLPPAAMVQVQNISQDENQIDRALRNFNKAFAINATLAFVGEIQLIKNQKFAKTELERDGVKWWNDEKLYQAAWIKRQSGAQVSDNEFARAEKTFITPDMTAQVMVDRMQQRRRNAAEDKRVFIANWTTSHRNPASRFPVPKLITNPQLKFDLPVTPEQRAEQRDDTGIRRI